MKVLPVDLNNMEHCNFAGLEVDFLQLNGKELWSNLTEQVGLDLNYTGLDVNGNVEGSLAFDGTIVAYAVGKPTITITTAEDGTQTENIVYSESNGYNSEYYGGYDFSKYHEGSISADEQIVPDVLEIPNTYNRLPVTTILDDAFDGGTPATTGVSNRYQAMCIKDVVFGSNIEEIRSSAFNGLTRYGIIDDIDTITTFNIPEGVKIILGGAFGNLAASNSVFNKLIIPESVEKFSGAFFTGSNASKIIYKSKNATSVSAGYLSHTPDFIYTIVFKKTVKQLNNTPFYNWIAKTLVFEHTDDDEITINIEQMKSAQGTNIYTDSTYIRNYDWASKNITPTFYSLSEYTGELE